ncbi:hypothetical protein Tco_0782414, partial [Tanacetum coccineum]
MTIPKEHMRRFHGMDDAKEIWEAIRTRFGSNANSKKMQKALEAHGAEVSTEDANHKFLRSLPPAWSNLAMTMRTKPDVDTLSIDDLKSSTKKVKSGFTGAYNTCTPSTSSTNIPKKEVLAGFADEKRRDSFYQHEEAGKQEKNQMGLLTMDDGIVNGMRHTKAEEHKSWPLMAYPAPVREENWNESCKSKEQLQKTLDSWKDSSKNLWRLINSGMSSSSKIGLGVPQEVYVSKPITTNEKGVSTAKSKEERSGNAMMERETREGLSLSSTGSLRVLQNVTNCECTLQTHNATCFSRKDEDAELIVVPSAVKNTVEKVETRKSSTNLKKDEFLTEDQQEKEASSTGTSEDNPKILAFGRDEPVKIGKLDTDDSPMPELEIFHKSETGIFDEASYEGEGLCQILGDPKSAVQTRSKVQQKLGARALISYIQKQQRNNHKDQQHCLFACFLSQEEPKKISEALQDDSWVQAMQEELLQFKLQQGQEGYQAGSSVLRTYSNKPKETKVDIGKKDEEADDVDVHLYSSNDASTHVCKCLLHDIYVWQSPFDWKLSLIVILVGSNLVEIQTGGCQFLVFLLGQGDLSHAIQETGHRATSTMK